MERRGSGLRKIIDQYPQEVIPFFRSTEQSFVVTLKNLNCIKVSMPCGDEVGVDNGDENTNLILNVILEDPKSTQKNIASKTGLSTRTVSRGIKQLRSAGMIRRVGSDRSGYWEVEN
jgi:ATP-dependent DNA helicase RecG